MIRAEFLRNVREAVQRLGENAKHTGKGLTEKEYAAVEKVYTYHPAIGNTDGKETIGLIFALGGMSVIWDMYSTALTVESLENDIEIAKSNLNKAQQRLDDFLGRIGER